MTPQPALTHHPQPAAVEAFARGEAPWTERVLLEAHLAFCKACADAVAALQALEGGLPNPVEALPAPEGLFDRILDRIDRHEHSARPDSAAVLPPGVLAELGDRVTSWTFTPVWPSGTRVAHLAHDEATGNDLFLTHFGPGRAFPQHTHVGLEENVLLAGGYQTDELFAVAGDWVRCEQGTHHSPATEPHQECWCLTRVEQGGVRLHGAYGVAQRLADLGARMRRA